jgi:hypothetical protein
MTNLNEFSKPPRFDQVTAPKIQLWHIVVLCIIAFGGEIYLVHVAVSEVLLLTRGAPQTYYVDSASAAALIFPVVLTPVFSDVYRRLNG